MSYVSDGERERAAALLRRQYLSGRLSHEQLSERVGRALHARDVRELRSALTDLPPLWRDLDEVRRVGRAVKRTAVVAAVTLLWLALSIGLLLSFAVDAAVRGVRAADVVAFALVWLLATLLLRRARRRA